MHLPRVFLEIAPWITCISKQRSERSNIMKRNVYFNDAFPGISQTNCMEDCRVNFALFGMTCRLPASIWLHRKCSSTIVQGPFLYFTITLNVRHFYYSWSNIFIYQLVCLGWRLWIGIAINYRYLLFPGIPYRIHVTWVWKNFTNEFRCFRSIPLISLLPLFVLLQA